MKYTIEKKRGWYVLYVNGKSVGKHRTERGAETALAILYSKG